MLTVVFLHAKLDGDAIKLLIFSNLMAFAVGYLDK